MDPLAVCVYGADKSPAPSQYDTIRYTKKVGCYKGIFQPLNGLVHDSAMNPTLEVLLTTLATVSSCDREL